MKINGMTCGMCSAAIEAGLENLKGVLSASVSYAKGKAVVEYDPAHLQLIELKEEIRNIGYSVDEQSDSKRR